MSQSRFFQLFYFHWKKRMDLVGIKTVYTCDTPQSVRRHVFVIAYLDKERDRTISGRKHNIYWESGHYTKILIGCASKDKYGK
jgi:hypothetical protein